MLNTDWVLSQKEFLLTGNPDEVRYNCPECDDDKFHMYVNSKLHIYICHKCGAKGKVINQSPFPDLSKFNESLAKVIASDLKYKGISLIMDEPKRTLPLHSLFFGFNNRANKAEVYKYLKSRGLTYRDIINYALISRDTHYPDSVIFPIYRRDSINLDYFVCRRYKGNNSFGDPKYQNAPWPKGDSLFITTPYDDGEGKLVNHKEQHFDGVIVEGVFDAIAISHTGYKGIALLGKKATPQQLERLIKEAKHGYAILLDHDAFSSTVQLALELRTLANIFRKNLSIRIMYDTGHGDPASQALDNMEALTEGLDTLNEAYRIKNSINKK